MIITILGIIIGALIFISGIYYMNKEKGDNESKKIYLTTTVIGAVILIGCVVKVAVFGF